MKRDGFNGFSIPGILFINIGGVDAKNPEF